MNNEYDIVQAFQRIEEILIKSMKRNLTRHLNEEMDLNMNWSAWQAEQLKALNQFKKENKKLFSKDFSTINSDIEDLIKKSYENGKLNQEKEILEAIKNGFFDSNDKQINKMWHIYKTSKNKRIKKKQLTRIYEKVNQAESTFFKINDRKLKALIKETKGNFRTAETSILRYTNDQYRKIIFDAQVYANTGSGTVQQAIDMATKDFLSKGINSIEYANGAMVNIASYVEMAIRTANKRAYLQGEGAKRDEWGVHTVLVPNRGGGCPYCIKFQGKVFIDDVWSGGSTKDGNYPLLSTAIKQRLFHPNCKDTVVTYFPGISTKPTPPTPEELERKKQNYIIEQKQRYIERQIRKYKRLEIGSTDEKNIEKYHNKRLKWQEYKKRFKENSNETFYGVTNDKNNDIIEIPNRIKEIAKKQQQTFRIEAENFVNQNTKEIDFLFDETFSKPMAYSISKDKIIVNPIHNDLEYYDIDESIVHEVVHLKDVRNKISENNFSKLNTYMDKIKNYFKSDMAYYGRIVADNEDNSSLCDLINIFTEGRVKNGAFAHKEDYISKSINCVREISATLISCDLTENKSVNKLIENIKPLKEMKEEVLKLWDVSK